MNVIATFLVGQMGPMTDTLSVVVISVPSVGVRKQNRVEKMLLREKL